MQNFSDVSFMESTQSCKFRKKSTTLFIYLLIHSFYIQQAAKGSSFKSKTMNNHYHLTSLQPSGSASMFQRKAQATAQAPTSGRQTLANLFQGLCSLSMWPTQATARATFRLHQPRCKCIRLEDPPPIMSLRIRDRLGIETGVERASSGTCWQHHLQDFVTCSRPQVHFILFLPTFHPLPPLPFPILPLLSSHLFLDIVVLSI